MVTYPQNHLLTRRPDWPGGALLGLKNHPCESQTSSKQCISATYGVKKAFMWAQSPLEGSSLPKFFINQWNLHNPYVKLTSVVVTCLVWWPFLRPFCCKIRSASPSCRHLLDFVAIARNANHWQICSKNAKVLPCRLRLCSFSLRVCPSAPKINKCVTLVCPSLPNFP